MMIKLLRTPAFALVTFLAATGFAQAGEVPIGAALNAAVKLSRLNAPDTRPFHLKATAGPANPYNAPKSAEIEVYWVSPTKWRRTVHSAEFDQTIIVNGDKRLEKNSADYLPKWLDDVVIALLDVVPEHTIEEVSKLDRQIDPNGGSVKYSPTSTDGTVNVMWWGSVDVRAGLLSWVSSTGFAAGFSEYQSFSGRMVARKIETFPLVERGDLVTRVTELGDLKDVDDSLFAIVDSTPQQDRLQLVVMNEVEYRKMAIDSPVMKWPPLKRQPIDGTLNMYIVTDRAGKVRECNFIVSSNMALKDSALELVKQWRFKPLLINGVPTEVGTTMTFPFSTTLEGDQAKYKAASYYFKRGRDLADPRTEGGLPFHMTGSFAWSDGRSTRIGHYEETWQSADHWRRKITMGDVSFQESRLEFEGFTQSPSRQFEQLARQVLRLYVPQFPGYAYASPDWDWRMDDVKLGESPLLRVSMGPTDNLKEHEYPRAYYFDSDGLVQAQSQQNELMVFRDFSEWNSKRIPRTIELKFNDNTVLEVHIDLVEATETKPDEFFEIPGVKPRDL